METPHGGGDHADAASPPPLSPASAALLNTRWNPSKEQVAVLEGLFEHGVRTPNAEQIQHITARLREHGPVEAKNVFYWFQNHKARDRQRNKQEGFAYFTRLLRRPPPLPVMATPPYQLARMPESPSPVLSMAPPNPSDAAAGGGSHHGKRKRTVVYRAPYYMHAPQASAANAGYYNLQHVHQRAVMYPRMDITQEKQMNPAGMYQAAIHYGTHNQLHVASANGDSGDGRASAYHRASRSRETLELFPLRPTFVLPENKARAAAYVTSPTPSAASASVSGGESESMAECPNSNAEAPLQFYDFLGLQSAGR